MKEEYIKFAYVDKVINPQTTRSYREIGRVNQVEWIKKTIEYIQLSSNYELRYDLRRGEIYEIDFGVNVNKEFSNRHYGVVLVDSNLLNPLVMVCPLKTNHNGAHKRSDVDLGVVEDLGKDHQAIAVINQIRTIDKFRILRRNQIGLKKLPLSIYEDEEIEPMSTPTVKRLNEKQLQMIICAYLNFIEYNGIMDISDDDDEYISR